MYFDNEEKMLTNYRLHMRFKEKFLEVMEDGGGFESLMELQDEPEVQENRQVLCNWPCLSLSVQQCVCLSVGRPSVCGGLFTGCPKLCDCQL